MNVKIEQKPLIDAAWITITCCRSVNGGSTFRGLFVAPVTATNHCLECYRKKKCVHVDRWHHRKSLRFWPFKYLGANWTQVFKMFKEFRALSLYQVCHSYLLKSDVAIHAFCDLICDSWLFVHLDGVPVKSFLVIILVYTTRTFLFLIRDPLSVFASLPEKGWRSHLLCAEERRCTVYNIVPDRICILLTNFPSS